MFDFTNGKELLELCKKHDMRISDIMLERESELFEPNKAKVFAEMEKKYSLMLESIENKQDGQGFKKGRLIGGEAKKMEERKNQGFQPVCGKIVADATRYAMAVMESNARMRLIVAGPTAGSSGVIPGVFRAFSEEFGKSNTEMTQALFNAAAIGWLIAHNASVSGAVAGCQAEVGSASAMAASAIVELMGGSAHQSLTAAAIALSNLLGLVCDPVAGLVEEPCQKRNAIGASNALISAEIALSGIDFLIPFDEMVDTMMRVGSQMPSQLRETAEGGIAIAPSAPTMQNLIDKNS